MTHDDAIERVAEAIHDVFRKWPSAPPEWEDMADAAIAAHAQYLRERSRDADVIEAAAKAVFVGENIDQSWHHVSQMDYRYTAEWALTAALDVLLGKETDDDSSSTHTTR